MSRDPMQYADRITQGFATAGHGIRSMMDLTRQQEAAEKAEQEKLASPAEKWLAKALAGEMSFEEASINARWEMQNNKGLASGAGGQEITQPGAVALPEPTMRRAPQQLPGEQAPAQRGFGLGNLSAPMAEEASTGGNLGRPMPAPQRSEMPEIRTKREFDSTVAAYSARRPRGLSLEERLQLERTKIGGRKEVVELTEGGKNARQQFGEEKKDFRQGRELQYKYDALTQKSSLMLKKMANDVRQAEARGVRDERIALLKVRAGQVNTLTNKIAAMRSALTELSNDPEAAETVAQLEARLAEQLDQLEMVQKDVEAIYGLDAQPQTEGAMPPPQPGGHSPQGAMPRSPTGRSQGGINGARPLPVEIDTQEPQTGEYSRAALSSQNPNVQPPAQFGGSVSMSQSTPAGIARSQEGALQSTMSPEEMLRALRGQ